MSKEIPAAAVYFMAVAERLTGLTARQIRYWEQQGLITPARTNGGHRLYSEADLVLLKEIKRLLINGSTLEQVKALQPSLGAWPLLVQRGGQGRATAADRSQATYLTVDSSHWTPTLYQRGHIRDHRQGSARPDCRQGYPDDRCQVC